MNKKPITRIVRILRVILIVIALVCWATLPIALVITNMYYLNNNTVECTCTSKKADPTILENEDYVFIAESGNLFHAYECGNGNYSKQKYGYAVRNFIKPCPNCFDITKIDKAYTFINNFDTYYHHFKCTEGTYELTDIKHAKELNKIPCPNCY